MRSARTTPSRGQTGAGLARRLNAERLVVLGWTRAILLQFAHPLIAAGVHEHSGFRRSPLAAVVRLRHTIKAMLALTFGDVAARHRTLETIRAIHRRVNGSLDERVGPFPPGTRYSAEDPALVLWVHLTLIESVVVVYERLVSRLRPDERDAYCAEAAEVAIALGADPAHVPRTWEGLRAAIEAGYESGAVVVGRQARELAAAVLHPRGAWPAVPLLRINETLAMGMLPPAVREQYGFRWTPLRARVMTTTVTSLRVGRQLCPDAFALWRDARATADAGSHARPAEAQEDLAVKRTT
jgi:uncharacterized protein (DUF2236 family)